MRARVRMPRHHLHPPGGMHVRASRHATGGHATPRTNPRPHTYKQHMHTHTHTHTHARTAHVHACDHTHTRTHTHTHTHMHANACLLTPTRVPPRGAFLHAGRAGRHPLHAPWDSAGQTGYGCGSDLCWHMGHIGGAEAVVSRGAWSHVRVPMTRTHQMRMGSASLMACSSSHNQHSPNAHGQRVVDGVQLLPRPALTIRAWAARR